MWPKTSILVLASDFFVLGSEVCLRITPANNLRVERLERFHGLDPREGLQHLGLTDSFHALVDRADNGGPELLQRGGVMAPTNSSIRP